MNAILFHSNLLRSARRAGANILNEGIVLKELLKRVLLLNEDIADENDIYKTRILYIVNYRLLKDIVLLVSATILQSIFTLNCI